ncbi:MAG: ribonuclease P protein component [Bacteriovoracia bacterium]
MILEGKSLKFSKTYRIQKKKDFEYLREQSRKSFVPPLVVYSKASRLGHVHSRLGLSVSTKQGGAVKRNRIKRILREEFRLSPHKMIHGLDLLVVAAQKIGDESKLRSSFRSILSSL